MNYSTISQTGQQRKMGRTSLTHAHQHVTVLQSFWVLLRELSTVWTSPLTSQNLPKPTAKVLASDYYGKKINMNLSKHDKSFLFHLSFLLFYF